MPLFKSWNPGTQFRAAIWKIEEDEAFFIEKTGRVPGREVSGLDVGARVPRHRIEHLASRYLLLHLCPDLRLAGIKADAYGKPRLLDGIPHFSLSHSYPYVAVVVADGHIADTTSLVPPLPGGTEVLPLECGIDIQTWRPRMTLLQHKFLSAEEQVFFGNDERLITLAWCAKEAAYKWQGRRGVDFINDMPIVGYEGGMIDIDLPNFEGGRRLRVSGMIDDGFALAVVADA